MSEPEFKLTTSHIYDHVPPKPKLAHGELEEQDNETVAAKEPKVLHALADLRREGIVLFTPALITAYGGFDRDPVVEFVRTVTTHDPAELPFTLDSDYQLFDGIGPGLLNTQLVDWNHRLYGVPEHVWPHLRDMLLAISWYDKKNYNFGRVGLHELQIVDPHALRNGSLLTDIPTVDIQVFCVSTLRGMFYLAPATDPPRTRATVARNAPDPQLVNMARAVLGPPPDPSAVLRNHTP